MTMQRVKVSENCSRLMIELDKTLGKFTTHTPMTLSDMIGVLAFMAGGAIGKEPAVFERNKLNEMAVANIKNGTEAVLTMNRRNSPLILPEKYHS